MTTELVRIPIPGAEPILALSDGARQWVAVRPMCERLGIDVDGQRRKLDQAEWACTELKSVHDASGRLQQMVMLDADHVPMWLGTIQTNRVNEAARPTLIAYQREAARALRDYFYTGVAVATELNQFDILRAAIDRLEESERIAAEAKQIAERSEARLDGIEGKHDWFSALGYAKLHGLPTYERFLRKLGKCASMIARTHDIQPEKAQHAHYGTVNSYPEWIWELAADGMGGEA
ncbi:antirepressor [Gordonia phage Lton]|nr:antirepressor [Gordonia phage Lton]